MTRKHHYISQLHLAGFTPSGTKEDFLYVLDKEKIEQRRQKVSEVAHQRDYYRLEGDGVAPNYLEDFFAKDIETPAADAFRYLIAHKKMPKGARFSALINYLALLGARVPTVINHSAKQESETMKWLLKARVSTPDHWNATVEGMRAAGKEVEAISYEEMKEFVNSDKYTIEVSQNTKVLQVIDAARILVPALTIRNWSIRLAGDSDFICSDAPICLIATVPSPGGFFSSPGFLTPDTEITVPISRKVALVGDFLGKSTVKTMNETGVAILNFRTALYATGFIYSTDGEFSWLRPSDKAICGVEEFKSRLSTLKSRGTPE